MEELTLEQEFEMYKNTHKHAVICGVVAQVYHDNDLVTGKVTINPISRAYDYVKTLSEEEFDKKYMECWEKVKHLVD